MAIGGALLALAWIRNAWTAYRHAAEQPLIDDARLTMTKPDRVLTWLAMGMPVLGVSAALGAGMVVVAAIAGTVLWVGALLVRTLAFGNVDFERKVFPWLEWAGVLRLSLVVMGVVALISGVDRIGSRGDDQQVLLATGFALVIAAFLERPPRKAIRRLPNVGATPEREIRDLQARIVAVEAALKDRAKTSTTAQPAPRPMWFIILATIALLAIAGYIIWAVLNRDDAATVTSWHLLALAGLALVLGVAGDRLSSFTVKAGTFEMGLASGGASVPAPAGSTTPSTSTQPPAAASAAPTGGVTSGPTAVEDLTALSRTGALGLRRVPFDPNDLCDVIVRSPRGLFNRAAFDRAARGEADVEAYEVFPTSPTSAPPSTPQRAMWVKGNVGNPADLMDQFFREGGDS
ncbi:MAG TPA: hypothetical protein VK988_02230 [Acidimicrobiales bacterium]|nr:hypothetical protein [Acidimicrobiales bacterium]